MASLSARRRLTIVTVVYWILLAYIVAALVWWFISLERQNRQMTSLRLEQLRFSPKNLSAARQTAVYNLEKRKTAQYIGEGFIFLLLILVGAVYIFRATRRQLQIGQQQQNFMMAVTHELKTPIAITTLNLETLQKRRLEEQQQQRLVSATLQEATRLNDLCNNILLTAQLEAGTTKMQKEELDLGDLVTGCVQHFQHRFPARSIQLIVEEEVTVWGEAFSLQMLVNNLLENAIKYSPKQAAIQVGVHKQGRKAVLQVKDEGAGIPDAEKKKVFQKFYRIGDERTRTSKGTGLGLYLCKRIMINHGGNIRLIDNVPHGSIFTATFR
jgi:two-component system, OmpR family, sensor histidine kinase CiaH